MRKLFLPQTEVVAALPWGKRRKPFGEAAGAWVAACYALHRCHLARYTIKDFDEEKKWVNLWSQLMGKLAKSGGIWADVKEMLLAQEILESDNDSKPGKKSFGFRLGPALADVRWKLGTDPFNIPDGAKFEHARRPAWPGLTIDASKAHAILKTIAPTRPKWTPAHLEAWHYRVDQFSPFYTVSNKCGRMTTDANQIPRETRAALLIHGKETAEIDIRSSHPMLLATLYPEKSKERWKYVDCLDSGIYEHFAGLFATDREGAKERFNPWLNGKSDKAFGEVFRREFPELAETVSKQKWGQLSNDLQRKEAVIIWDACQKFGAVSIHDGIRLERSKEREARAYLLNSIQERHGLRAFLK